ncbi:hypothetical protein B0T22DRAFT_299391 [Podospora appendiculata]|uniref:Uncharacterized protein n=1 Tax=Podospora appendiculata TaxID=314037 RepID=A0AAE0WZJ6_9PEZI|nr:hypothetical protein B0T22DRAFT_299391 [Podospora appendiculata]
MGGTRNITERWDDISAEPPPIHLGIGPDMQLGLNQPLKLPIVACVPITRRLGEQPSHASNLFAMAVMVDHDNQPLVVGALAGNRTASPAVVAEQGNTWYYFVFPDLVPTSAEAVRMRIVLQRMDFAVNEHVCLATVSSRPFTVREKVEVTQVITLEMEKHLDIMKAFNIRWLPLPEVVEEAKRLEKKRHEGGRLNGDEDKEGDMRIKG